MVDADLEVNNEPRQSSGGVHDGRGRGSPAAFTALFNMPLADIEVNDRFEILARAVALAPVGLCCEFGVAGGRTVNFIARCIAPRRVYGFDSFRGLPEPWAPGYDVGHFACTPPAVADNVELIIGDFANTIAPFLEMHHDNVAFAHIDCDLYSSTRTVLEALAPRIVAGTVIVFDEFWIMPRHERAAFEDFLLENSRTCRYECRAAEQLCVVME
jgi:hypothetical protein